MKSKEQKSPQTLRKSHSVPLGIHASENSSEDSDSPVPKSIRKSKSDLFWRTEESGPKELNLNAEDEEEVESEISVESPAASIDSPESAPVEISSEFSPSSEGERKIEEESQVRKDISMSSNVQVESTEVSITSTDSQLEEMKESPQEPHQEPTTNDLDVKSEEQHPQESVSSSPELKDEILNTGETIDPETKTEQTTEDRDDQESEATAAATDSDDHKTEEDSADLEKKE